MKYYQATRSLYGDLGSIRRNEKIPLNDPRLVDREKALKDLLKRGLLVQRSGDDSEGDPATRKPAKAGRQNKETGE